MKLALITLVVLALCKDGEAECLDCNRFVGTLIAVLFSPENIDYQIEVTTEAVCTDDLPPDCPELMVKEWPWVVQAFMKIANLVPGFCNMLEAYERCEDFQSSTTDNDICVARVNDFAATKRSEDFDKFVDYMASEEGFCGIKCEQPDAGANCLEECRELEEYGIPIAFGALVAELEINAQVICEVITSN